MATAWPTDTNLKEFLFVAGLIDSATSPTAPFDVLPYATAAAAAQEEFERLTRRTFIGVAATTQKYDHPVNEAKTHQGSILDLKGEWTAITSIVRDGETLTVTDDYILIPDEVPYTHVRLLTNRTSPTPWALIHEVVVTGTRGFGAVGALPDDVYLATLKRAAAKLVVQIASQESGGVVRQAQADASEEWGTEPMSGLAKQWNEDFMQAVNVWQIWGLFS